MRRFPVFYRGAPCGEMTVAQEGLYLQFYARAALKGKVIPRIYLKGERGEMLLGVAEPAEGGYLLRRRISAGAVEPLGVLQCAQVSVQGEKEDSWRLLGGEEVQLCRRYCHALPSVQTGLFRLCCGVREIAFPCGERMPFPMVGLFCLARIEKIRGREYAVFSFDQKGEPILTKK